MRYIIYLSWRVFRMDFSRKKRGMQKTLYSKYDSIIRVGQSMYNFIKLNLMKIKVNHKDPIVRGQIRDGVLKYEAINEIMDTERVSIKKARIILKQRDKKARKDWAKLRERMELWKKSGERVDAKMQEKIKRLEERWS